MAKEKLVEVHIKIPEEDYEFMVNFKKEFGVSLQNFTIKAIKEKISNIKTNM